MAQLFVGDLEGQYNLHVSIVMILNDKIVVVVDSIGIWMIVL